MFWASMVKEAGDEASKQRIYASRTKDFHCFTPAEKFQEGENHIIDTTILKAGEFYYRFAKDETVKNIRLDRSRSLDKDSFEPVEAPVNTRSSVAWRDRRPSSSTTGRVVPDGGPVRGG